MVVEVLATYLGETWASKNQDPRIKDYIERYCVEPVVPNDPNGFLFVYDRTFLGGDKDATGTRAKNDLARNEVDRLIESAAFWQAFFRGAATVFGIDPDNPTPICRRGG